MPELPMSSKELILRQVQLVEAATRGLDLSSISKSYNAQIAMIAESLQTKTAWQTDLVASIEQWNRSLVSPLVELQRTISAWPQLDLLEKNMRIWKDYFRTLPTFPKIELHQLDALQTVLREYDHVIDRQVDAFAMVPSIRPYQKRQLVAHEVQQKTIRLGPADIDKSSIITTGISATQSFVDEVAGIRREPQVGASEVEGEAFKALAELGPGYLAPLQGAIQTARSDNPDRARQTIASLRELSTHILHLLAPDAEVLRWVTKPEHIDKGRPTRPGRVEYIFRNCVGTSIEPFIKNEVQNIQTLFGWLNEGTHALKASFNDDALMFVICKTECYLLLLLKYARR
jgi:hypothetical protein